MVRKKKKDKTTEVEKKEEAPVEADAEVNVFDEPDEAPEEEKPETPEEAPEDEIPAGMHRFIGVKIVDAKKMKLGEYNLYRGWDIPENEDPETGGYLVKYSDDYESWCPTRQFEEANRVIGGLTFGHAIEAAKKGLKIARAGWNGKNMFVYLVKGTEIKVGDLRNEAAEHVGNSEPKGAKQEICSHLDMCAADGSIVVGWLASQTDILAEDWEIVK